MSKRSLVRAGYFVSGLLTLPAAAIIALLMFLDSPINPTPAGGFGADLRLVYLMIFGGPLIVLGLIILVVTTCIWLFTGRSTNGND